MKFSIRTKLRLSYAAVILLMAAVSVVFMTLFADRIIIQEADRQMKDFSEKIIVETIGNKRSPTQEDFKKTLSKAAEREYAAVLFAENGECIWTFRTDSLSINEPTLLSAVRSRTDHPGTSLIKETSATFAVYSRPIKIITQRGVSDNTIVFITQADTNRFNQARTAFFITSICIAAVVSGILSFIFSKKMTSNLKKLQKLADALARRDFTSNVMVSSDDELGDLAKSMNIMAQSIKEYDSSQKLFLQNASHELKTPLMSIQGFVEGVKDGIFTDTDKVCDDILVQTHRLEKIIEDVLYLSKIETTKEMFNAEPIAVSEITDEAFSRVAGIAASNNLSLIKGNIEDVYINADPDRMATALTNIISNCLRFAKTNVTLDVLRYENDVCFIVTDDGTGISDTDLPHIFDRFYKGKNGKHGLGLAIAKAVVVQHGGTISAYNRTDGVVGAVFEIRIPVAQIIKTLE